MLQNLKKIFIISCIFVNIFNFNSFANTENIHDFANIIEDKDNISKQMDEYETKTGMTAYIYTEPNADNIDIALDDFFNYINNEQSTVFFINLDTGDYIITGGNKTNNKLTDDIINIGVEKGLDYFYDRDFDNGLIASLNALETSVETNLINKNTIVNGTKPTTVISQNKELSSNTLIIFLVMFVLIFLSFVIYLVYKHIQNKNKMELEERNRNLALDLNELSPENQEIKKLMKQYGDSEKKEENISNNSQTYKEEDKENKQVYNNEKVIIINNEAPPRPTYIPPIYVAPKHKPEPTKKSRPSSSSNYNKPSSLSRPSSSGSFSRPSSSSSFGSSSSRRPSSSGSFKSHSSSSSRPSGRGKF